MCRITNKATKTITALSARASMKTRSVRFAVAASSRKDMPQLALSENEILSSWYTLSELDRLRTRARDDAARACRKRSRAGETLSVSTSNLSPRGDEILAPMRCGLNQNENSKRAADGEAIDCRGLEHWLGSDRKRRRCRTIRAVLGAQDKLRIHLDSISSSSARDTERAAAALAVYSRRRTRCAEEAARCAGHADFVEAYGSLLEFGDAPDFADVKSCIDMSPPLREEVVAK